MSSVFNAIYTILKSDSNIAPLVRDGNSPSYTYRIYELYTSQTATAPYITCQQLNIAPNNTKDGPSPLDEYSYQINIVAQTPQDAHTLAGYVRAALDYYSGTTAGVNVQKIFFETETNLWDDDSHLKGVAAFAQDYKIRIVR